MGSNTGPRPKVERVVEKYDLDVAGDELVAQWTAEDDDRSSLRDLAAEFNRLIVAAALDRADVTVFDGGAANVYRLLTADDVSGGVRTETRRRLEQAGVDVGALERDLVTHQAIYTYLTKHRNASYEPPDDGDQLGRDRQRFERLREKLSAVTTETIDRLDRTDRLDVGEFDVFVDTTVRCRDCARGFTVWELLESGGCECGDG
jgi:hypothetical protein